MEDTSIMGLVSSTVRGASLATVWSSGRIIGENLVIIFSSGLAGVKLISSGLTGSKLTNLGIFG